MTARYRVGTRRSRLARAQTEIVLQKLRRARPAWELVPVPIDASGDRDRSKGGSTDFTDRIDRALLRGEVDLAVHSAKDLPVRLDPRFRLAAVPRRADPRDCLVTALRLRGGDLPRGTRVGSSSPRRRAQLLGWRPDLDVVEIRGNVDTRIAMVRSGTIDAAILAVAGIARLGWTEEIDRVLPTARFLPAPGQGAIAVVSGTGDRDLLAGLDRIDHPATRACVRAERAFAAALGGDCRAPLAARARAERRTLALTAEVLAPDGRTRLRARRQGPVAQADRIGLRLGKEILDGGAMQLWGRKRG